MIETKDELLDELVDLILASDFAKETVADTTISRDGDYLSVHSRNMDIIYQFPIDRDFINAHPELKKALQAEFEDYLHTEIAPDLDYFEAWLYGNRVTFGYKDYESTLKEELDAIYRKRITDTFKCDKCGTEISEKNRYEHPKSVHRVGIRVNVDPERYDWKIYCKPCYDRMTKLR